MTLRIRGRAVVAMIATAGAASLLAPTARAADVIAGEGPGTIAAALASARDWQGRYVEVVAEPGMGKSRLIDELRSRAHGVTVVAAACVEYESATPYYAVRSLLRRLLGLEPVISMGICGPTHDERSWTFDLDPGGRDPVPGYERLQEALRRRRASLAHATTEPTTEPAA